MGESGDMGIGELEKMLTDVRRSRDLIEKKDALNAFINLNSNAEEEARTQYGSDLQNGPLFGKLLAVKDNIEVAGLPTTAGTLGLENYVPTSDAEIVKRLKSAGAIVMGKANMHELAYGITSKNSAYGAVGNSVDPDFFAGGSSGGTAVAVALGMVDLGIGTDTGGSCRIPAALNGVVGYRPTVGRYPHDGIVRISSTRDTAGPIAKTVKEVRLLDSVMSQTNSSLSVDLTNVRIGVPRSYFFEDLESSIAQGVESLLSALSKSGVTLIEADLPDIGELNEKVGFPVVLYETGLLLTAFARERLNGASLDDLVNQVSSPDVSAMLQDVIHGAVTQQDYERAMQVFRPRLQSLYQTYFEDNDLDAALFPTTPLTARAMDNCEFEVSHNESIVPTFPTFIRNTDPGSNAGIPGLSLPLGAAPNGMPFGIEVDGPKGSDEKLLAIGEALEIFIKRHTHELTNLESQ